MSKKSFNTRDYEFNTTEIFGKLSDIDTYIEEGAGSQPTGAAVHNDLFYALNQLEYNHIEYPN